MRNKRIVQSILSNKILLEHKLLSCNVMSKATYNFKLFSVDASNLLKEGNRDLMAYKRNKKHHSLII